jgi:exopolysaccharide biosynthesis polyprenyl glycosylphosphotransferase
MSTIDQSGGRGRAALAERLRLSLDGVDRVERLAAGLSASVVADRHVSRDYYLHRFLAGVDALALVVAVLLAFGVSDEVTLWALLTIPPWLLLFHLYGLYGHDSRRISHTGAEELPGIFHAMAIGAFSMWGYFHFVPGGKVEFAPILVFVAIAGAVMLALRAAARFSFVRIFGPERVLFVGSGPSTGLLIQRMRAQPSYGLEPVGLVSDTMSVTMPMGLPLLGELRGADVATLIVDHRIDRVVVEFGGFADEAILQLLRRCKQLSVKVSLLPAAFGVLGTSVAIDHVGGVTLLGVNPPVLPRSARVVKRAMDVCGALLLLLAFAPLLLLIALAIRIESRGPVIFRQNRVGKGGKPFRIVKFRTMVHDAEALRAKLLPLSKSPDWLLLDADPRITRVGRLLRRSSLDELPQLINVLKGEMSLVGPRPLMLEDHHRIGEEWARNRLDLTPGMTGLWQVLGRTTIPFDEMIKLDYLYVTNWTLWGDVKLVLQTLPIVLAQRGAG